LTERTFFRHFADKREVLFGGQELLRDVLIDAVAAAPGTGDPMTTAVAAYEAVGEAMQERRDHARKRQAVIGANLGLQERELIKVATLAATLSEALIGRGVPEVAASVAAETATGLFRVAFVRWIADDNTATLARLIREAFEELRALLARV
jgi:AcrR family transcriptional regulator